MSALTIFLSPFIYTMIGGLTATDSDMATLTSHMQQMENALSTLQAQSQIQEQKQAAVLSSVLAKLMETNSELTALKTNYSSLENELTRQRDNQSNQVKQLEQTVSSLQSQLTETTRELTALKTNCSSLENALITPHGKNNSNQVQQLEQTVSSLQSQAQNQSKTLSQVLSKLAQTMDIQKSLTANCTSFEDKLVILTDQFKGNKAAWNKANLHTENNVKVLQAGIKSMQSKMVSTDASLAAVRSGNAGLGKTVSHLKALLNINVAFEAGLSQSSYRVSKGSILKFTKSIYNDGGAYRTSSGYFTAPVPGTYIFWINCNFVAKSLQINIIKNSGVVASGIGSGSIGSVPTGTITRTSVFILRKGDRVHFSSTGAGTLTGASSSIGGALVQPKY